MSAVDNLADKAEVTSQRLAGQSGLKGKLADELADDAVFLRKLKPSLMKTRLRSQAPTDEKPGEPRKAPPGPKALESDAPQLGTRPSGKAGGPNPFAVVGAALIAGVILAKWIDWRGHAHPRW